MRIATYNIQNLFNRSKQLVKEYHGEHRTHWMLEFDQLIQKKGHTMEELDRMRVLSHLLGFNQWKNSPNLSIVDNTILLKINPSTTLKKGRANNELEWDGWLELDTIPINPVAISNKAKVIREVAPDVLVLQEVEGRSTLVQFCREFLFHENEPLYPNILYFGTNDSMGRGIGVLSKSGYPLTSIKTHVNEKDENGNPVFAFDLQEYQISTPQGNEVSILATHLPEETENEYAHSENLVNQLALIEQRISAYSKTKQDFIFLGTLNINSFSGSMQYLKESSGIKDVSKHASFTTNLDLGKDSKYYRLGAYKMGVNLRQKDYLMFPLHLYKKITACGMNRKGMWPHSRPSWPLYASIKNEVHTASKHPLMWADLSIK